LAQLCLVTPSQNFFDLSHGGSLRHRASMPPRRSHRSADRHDHVASHDRIDDTAAAARLVRTQRSAAARVRRSVARLAPDCCPGALGMMPECLLNAARKPGPMPG
jgi:hypothetical protein